MLHDIAASMVIMKGEELLFLEEIEEFHADFKRCKSSEIRDGMSFIYEHYLELVDGNYAFDETYYDE